jgi:hypothetical protein
MPRSNQSVRGCPPPTLGCPEANTQPSVCWLDETGGRFPMQKAKDANKTRPGYPTKTNRQETDPGTSEADSKGRLGAKDLLRWMSSGTNDSKMSEEAPGSQCRSPYQWNG